MRAGQLQGAAVEYASVPADVVMIAGSTESAAAVLSLQSFGSKRIAFPCGAAMHHDVVDFSHDDFVFQDRI
ncbi:hypothetical protein HMPREF9446_02577 [Bacteroides fluxus YIT 12057]|uniref:Uncharacterized protein n=1 Tax=Bacteroides fluxus YIT 12057 TaxID=763034 RepID=F3PV03_9BACE|nr:hypothetical protein HMPREF9446_02577 [Bacteroides fluxus YIT 12057]